MTAAHDLLETIVAAARTSARVRESHRPAHALRAAHDPRGTAFARALRESATPRVIAECKRRSPSRGILRQHYQPAEHARAYAAAGAAAISVLTEPSFFDGAAAHLEVVRSAVDLPILRKDFIVTDYQVHEAAALGADAVLLIAGALDDAQLRRLRMLAESLGLAALIEVHDGTELERALAAGADLVGVNSRNLRTLEIDRDLFERLAPALPRDVVKVAESGISGPADVRRIAALGYDAFLVGERLIAQPDPGAALRELRQT